MSTFRCEVVPVALEPHPNADTLSLVKVYDFTAIVRTEEWRDRSLGVYVPVDAIVPDVPEFAFLDGHRRIKARKLRGIFSMGLIVPVRDGMVFGDDVTEAMGVTRYDPDQFTDSLSMSGEDEHAPSGLAPKYTDIESLRRHRGVLQAGEQVIVTEKIHGCNARYLVDDEGLHAGSRTRWKRKADGSVWWQAAERAELASRIPQGIVVYGEVYGQVQDLRYGAGKGEVRLRAFDVFDRAAGRYLDADDMTARLATMGIEQAPILFAGPFDYEALSVEAERDSIVDGCGGIREGLVIRPAVERIEYMGRVILKLHSQRYLLRKGA